MRFTKILKLNRIKRVEFIKLGFYVGVGGPITHANNKKTRKMVKGIDINHILVETDSPYLPPEEKRGEKNTSLNLKYIIRKILVMQMNIVS